MSHKLLRLTDKRFLNKPHLIDSTALDNISSYLEDRNEGVVELALQANRLEKALGVGNTIEAGVAILAVHGPLTYETSGFEALCGGASYQGLLNSFDDVVQKGAKTVVLDIDSPGGEAFGLFETGRELRSRADAAGVKLISYVDGLAASAGYGLAVSAHEVISNPQSEVGSVGVVVRLMNTNQAQADAGVKTTYVFAGDSKIPFDAEGNFSESFLSDLQDKVDVLYEDFTAYIAEMTSLDQQVVKNTEAKTFMADKALELGLVDSLLTREEFFEKLAQDKEGVSMPLLRKTGDKKEMSDKSQEASTQVEEGVVANLADLQEQVAQLTAKLESDAKEKAVLAEQVKQTKLADLEAVAGKWGSTGVDPKAYAEAVLNGSIPVEMFDNAMEKSSESLEKVKKQSSNLKVEIEALKEVGVATAEVQPVEEDGVEKELKKQGKIKG